MSIIVPDGDIPEPLTYGTVVGHFISVLADSSDVGSRPDITYLNGTVTIRPVINNYRVTNNDGLTYLVVAQNIEAIVQSGVLMSPDASTPLRLLASNSPGLSPSPLQYTAKFNLRGVVNQPSPLTFNVPSNGTVDISAIVSVPSTPPVQTVVVTQQSLQPTVDNAGNLVITY